MDKESHFYAQRTVVTVGVDGPQRTPDLEDECSR